MRHTTDLELVRLADGELNLFQARRVRAHLESCPACRGRGAELERSVTDYLLLYRSAATAGLPCASGPRTSLRTRMALEAGPALPVWCRPLVTMAACAALFFCLANRSQELSEPTPALTPGETRVVTLGQVCRGESDATVPVSLRERVFREYGISAARLNNYEVDYLITPALGGADSIRNLWPEPYATEWNAHVKDALENRLHDLVCAGKLDLRTAQKEIATDWIGAYKRYFHTTHPLPEPGGRAASY